jgi:outer membrane protein assembly factor BamB
MKTWFNKALFTVAIATVLVGCSSEEDTVIMAPLPVVKSEFTPSAEWSTSISSGVTHYFSKLKAISAYDKLYVASRDGVIKALDPASGKVLWKTDLEVNDSARLSGGITASYNQLFIGSENGLVYAIDAETGKTNWQTDIHGEVLAAPATDSNLVIVNTSEGILVALDQKTGTQAWTISTEVPNLTLRGVSAPTAMSGGVFWGTAGGRLAAAIVSRGQLIWQQTVGSPKGSTEIDRLIDVDSSPTIIGGTLFVVGYNGSLVSFDLRTGKPNWRRKYSSATDTATDGSRLFVVTNHDHLVAVDLRSGTELWSNAQLENRLLTAPVVVNNYLVVGDSQGYLHWLDRTSGKFVAQQFINDSGFSVGPTVMSDGYVIVTRDGAVKKLKLN